MSPSRCLSLIWPPHAALHPTHHAPRHTCATCAPHTARRTPPRAAPRTTLRRAAPRRATPRACVVRVFYQELVLAQKKRWSARACVSPRACMCELTPDDVRVWVGMMGGAGAETICRGTRGVIFFYSLFVCTYVCWFEDVFLSFSLCLVF
jgi:hypothetical protein